MGAGSIGRWARAGADVGCTRGTGSATVVAVAVNTGIGNVRDLRAVGSVGTGRVIVASCAMAGVSTGRANTSSVAGRANTSVGTSRAKTSSVAGGTNTGVGASRTGASSVTC